MAMIGLSHPFIAKYANNGTTVTYSDGVSLGKFTNLSISIDDPGRNDFYADNGIAESDNSVFTSGTVTVTTDDLTPASLVKALGLTEESIAATIATTTPAPKWMVFSDSQSVPFIGLGGVIKRIVGGVTKWQAFVLNKVRLANPSLTVATQGETIEWQTSELGGAIYRSDRSDHRWYQISTYLDSEADAIAAVEAFL